MIARDAVTAALVFVFALGAIFVVTGLIGMAVTGGGHRHQRADRSRLDIGNLGNALKLYRAKTGTYPDATGGLT
ncbi:MAG TPA: hypothetical protein VFE93_19005, partial [Myxococcaceae bacterium]|nr:hypothetical protein [Myxococcaceae bacterium]